MTRRNPNPKQKRQYRWGVASRVLAAALGGYALSSSVMAVLALLLSSGPGSNPATAVLITTLSSFALYTAIVIWAFSTSSALRAWLGLGIGSLLSAAAVLALQLLT
jgi:hypothetical protein